MSDKINPARILILGPSWVGDMVMAQSLFIALKQSHPNCEIDVLAPVWTFALLERMPEVSHALAMPTLGRGQLALMERIKLGRSLRSRRYDQAILLPNTWKSALIPYFADIPLRTGYIGECRWGVLNDLRRLDKSVLTKTVQRFVALAAPLQPPEAPFCPAPRLSVNLENRRQALQKFRLPAESQILALCPGAEYGEAKRWPVAHYAQVASAKIKEGWQVWLFGSKKDAPIAAQINQLTDNGCIDLTGNTSISEAVDLLSLADVVISNDSGLMHVAAALNKKLIALYGSSDPNFTPPLTTNAKILSLGLTCSPCFKRECPFGHTQCLVNITPQMVIDEVNGFFS
ncbi:MAG: lipopolysaccharide heptosyltransferase II [Gammaproteobacteria bacterium]